MQDSSNFKYVPLSALVRRAVEIRSLVQGIKSCRNFISISRRLLP